MLDKSTLDYTNRWSPDAAASFVELPAAGKVRYLKVGSGPTLVLLHTIRTQLDLFQKVIPLLKDHFTVYALDYPGFGWSDIRPGSDYREPTLRRQIIEFIDAFELGDGLSLAGESIGGSLALTVASELGPKVSRVIAVNPYDYLPGIERASAFAAFIVKGVKAPIVGPTLASLENRMILSRIMGAGVYDKAAMPSDFIDELEKVGKRPGYSGVARAVFKSLPSYVAARALYRSIKSPVTLIYGDHDWSRPSDRDADLKLVPEAHMVTLERTGHFASLEQPREIARLIIGG